MISQNDECQMPKVNMSYAKMRNVKYEMLNDMLCFFQCGLTMRAAVIQHQASDYVGKDDIRSS